MRALISSGGENDEKEVEKTGKGPDPDVNTDGRWRRRRALRDGAQRQAARSFLQHWQINQQAFERL
jgi:hypothetical protein